MKNPDDFDDYHRNQKLFRSDSQFNFIHLAHDLKFFIPKSFPEQMRILLPIN